MDRPPVDRAQLERMSRDDLITHAEGIGVDRARILTRPELIDEILLGTLARANKRELRRARGFFGMARDLIQRVVERGLHLPDAAERLKSLVPPPPTMMRSSGGALPTVTLAEIYAAQGHTDRAIETLERVIAGEPEHAAAHALVAKLRATDYVAPSKPELPPEQELPPPAESDTNVEDEALGATTTASLEEDRREDTLDVTALEDGTFAVSYVTSVETLTRALVRERPLVLRAARFEAHLEGTVERTTDTPVFDREGTVRLVDTAALGCCRVALGWVDDARHFHSVVHAPLVEPRTPVVKATSRRQPNASQPHAS